MKYTFGTKAIVFTIKTIIHGWLLRMILALYLSSYCFKHLWFKNYFLSFELLTLS